MPHFHLRRAELLEGADQFAILACMLDKVRLQQRRIAYLSNQEMDDPDGFCFLKCEFNIPVGGARV